MIYNYICHVTTYHFIIFSCSLFWIAYEILGVPQKRRAYDSVDPLFDDTVPAVNTESKLKFYEVFGPVFEQNSRFGRISNPLDFIFSCIPALPPQSSIPWPQFIVIFSLLFSIHFLSHANIHIQKLKNYCIMLKKCLTYL